MRTHEVPFQDLEQVVVTFYGPDGEVVFPHGGWSHEWVHGSRTVRYYHDFPLTVLIVGLHPDHELPVKVVHRPEGNWYDDDNAARLRLAREALVATGYFSADQVGDDVAPRITEYASFMESALEQARANVVTAEEYNDVLAQRDRAIARADENYEKLLQTRVAMSRLARD